MQKLIFFWSESKLNEHDRSGPLYINAMIYSEVSIGFERIEDIKHAVHQAGLKMLELPKEALLFLDYRKRKGAKRSPLPDFFIGAQAAVMHLPLITRNVSSYQLSFPRVALIHP